MLFHWQAARNPSNRSKSTRKSRRSTRPSPFSSTKRCAACFWYRSWCRDWRPYRTRLSGPRRQTNGLCPLKHSELAKCSRLRRRGLEVHLRSIDCHKTHWYNITGHFSSCFFSLFSTVLGRTTYIGFFVDWLLEAFSISVGFLIESASTSMFIGILYYISAMISDLNARIMSVNGCAAKESLQQRKALYSTYVDEMEFYTEIIG